MALVHQMLYRSKDLAHINFLDYLKTVVDSLVSMYGAEAGADRSRGRRGRGQPRHRSRDRLRADRHRARHELAAPCISPRRRWPCQCHGASRRTATSRSRSATTASDCPTAARAGEVRLVRAADRAHAHRAARGRHRGRRRARHLHLDPISPFPPRRGQDPRLRADRHGGVVTGGLLVATRDSRCWRQPNFARRTARVSRAIAAPDRAAHLERRRDPGARRARRRRGHRTAGAAREGIRVRRRLGAAALCADRFDGAPADACACLADRHGREHGRRDAHPRSRSGGSCTRILRRYRCSNAAARRTSSASAPRSSRAATASPT